MTINMENEQLKYRMYCLVLKQLNPIQKGIQAAHSIVEYGNEFFDDRTYVEWCINNKTIIMLDGGTAPEMKSLLDSLQDTTLNFAYFKEPDLNNIVTSICFIADEYVYDDKYEYMYNEDIPYMSDRSIFKNIIKDRRTSK